MIKMGFGRKWINWILNCVCLALMSILLNGSSLKPFNMEKGLRQGDPLSPYLFILISEALVWFFKNATDLNLIEPVLIGKNKVRLNLLQFADDTLMFVTNNPQCITNYFRILDIFAVMSSLNLNFSKSNFITWKLEDHVWASELAVSVGCIHTKCPITYLGFPLGKNMNRCSTWKPVLEKIHYKLSSWKARLLSRADRLTFIKSVLNSLPVHYMSIFKIPKIVAQKIVYLKRRFFLGDSSNGKMSLPAIKWANIELPKQLGGLGVVNILFKNLILLVKWWWHYSESGFSLWKKIMMSVHNIRCFKASCDSFNSMKYGTLSQLVRNDVDISKIRDIVEEGMILEIGNGGSILFWQDRWCENGPLARAFPRLFALSLQKDCFVNQMGVWFGESWSWNLSWRMALFDWE